MKFNKNVQKFVNKFTLLQPKNKLKIVSMEMTAK